MIKIYNPNKRTEIIIDECHELIIFEPRHYEDLPYVKISLSNIDWIKHKESCEDCKMLYRDFGTSNYDWKIEYPGFMARLNLAEFGPKNYSNTISRNVGDYFNGTILKLNLDTDSIEQIEVLLEVNETLENDEKCCFLRDKINALKQLPKTKD